MAPPSGPETVDEYVAWAAKTLGIDFAAPASRNQYETNVQNAQNAVQNSLFMREFPAFLAKQEEEHQKRTGAGLLMLSELTVHRKPFSSAVTKSFRINVLRNNGFPNPPNDGWITPDNWYGRFPDLVRSTLVCRFLDGPKGLALALDEYAKSMGLTGRHIPRNTDDGYYAFHQHTGFPVDIVDANWQTQATTVEFEIQLTTQLQEVLRDLTHPLYERARVATGQRDDHWKWEHDTLRFRTSYLGHTLHMIEAVIVQVRDSTTATPEAVPQTTAIAPQKRETTEPPHVESEE
jgi:hypothetical protein